MPAPLSETWGGDFLGKSVHNKWRAVDTSWYTLSPPSRFVWVKKAFRETDYPMFKTKKKNFNLDQNHCLLRRTYIHSLTIGSCISTMRPVECVYNLKMRDRYADDERGQEFFIQMVAIFCHQFSYERRTRKRCNTTFITRYLPLPNDAGGHSAGSFLYFWTDFLVLTNG